MNETFQKWYMNGNEGRRRRVKQPNNTDCEKSPINNLITNALDRSMENYH